MKNKNNSLVNDLMQTVPEILETKDIVLFLKNLQWNTLTRVNGTKKLITLKFEDINKATIDDTFPHNYIFNELIMMGLTNLNMLDYFYDDDDVLHIINTGSKINNDNLQFSPHKISSKSNLEVWWMCKNQHDYKAKVSDRCNSKFNNCPICGE